MCVQRFFESLRRWSIKRKFNRIHQKYDKRLEELDFRKRSLIHQIWIRNQESQIEYYVECIDFRLYFIGSSINSETLKKVRNHKRNLIYKKDFQGIIELAEVIYGNNLENIEPEIIALTNTRRGSWNPWK